MIQLWEAKITHKLLKNAQTFISYSAPELTSLAEFPGGNPLFNARLLNWLRQALLQYAPQLAHNIVQGLTPLTTVAPQPGVVVPLPTVKEFETAKELKQRAQANPHKLPVYILPMLDVFAEENFTRLAVRANNVMERLSNEIENLRTGKNTAADLKDTIRRFVVDPTLLGMSFPSTTTNPYENAAVSVKSHPELPSALLHEFGHILSTNLPHTLNERFSTHAHEIINDVFVKALIPILAEKLHKATSHSPFAAHYYGRELRNAMEDMNVHLISKQHELMNPEASSARDALKEFWRRSAWNPPETSPWQQRFATVFQRKPSRLHDKYTDPAYLVEMENLMKALSYVLAYPIMKETGQPPFTYADVLNALNKLVDQPKEKYTNKGYLRKQRAATTTLLAGPMSKGELEKVVSTALEAAPELKHDPIYYELWQMKHKPYFERPTK